MKTVCIVILNYNNYDDTIECIKSVKQIDYPSYEIVMVDNCSHNESVYKIKEAFGDTVTYIETGKNLGYAGGNNVGLRYALENGFDYLCVLNNDTVVESDFLTKCVNYLDENKDAAFVGPIVLEYLEDSVQATGGEVIEKKGITTLLNNGKTMKDLPSEIECDFISGACMVFTADFIRKHSLIPENYFLFYEETEWCYRAKKMGYRNVCINNTFIRHKGSVSINQIQGLNAYLMDRNRMIFYKRNIGNGLKYVYFIFYVLVETVYLSIRYDLKNIFRLKHYFDGVLNRISKKYPFVIINND